MLDFLMLANRQGKVRMVRWYHPGLTQPLRHRITTDLPPTVLTRAKNPHNTAMFDWHGHYRRDATRIVYRRYASLYFIFAMDPNGNPLVALDLIHSLVETLDKYFGSVCELDLVFDFHKTANVVDEWWCGGRVAVGGDGRAAVVTACRVADERERQEKEEARSNLAMF